jgi:hypothetical protein
MAEAEAVDAGIVRDRGQALDAGIAQGSDQRFGNAAQAEAADRERLPILATRSRRAVAASGYTFDLPRAGAAVAVSVIAISLPRARV